MNILLTNDDGINGAGLAIIAQKLDLVCNVYMLVPSGERSGVSHCITMDKPLLIKKLSERKYTCSGFPVDCVVTALRSNMFGVKFDAVVSGINRGANMGTDVVYSGTAAAARQAALYGVPGIAVSLDSDDDVYDYEAIAEFVAKNIRHLASLSAGGVFVNINAESASSYSGVVFSPLCRRDYRDTVHVYTGDDGNTYSIFEGGTISTGGDRLCDYNTVKSGKIAVSLLPAEPVCTMPDSCLAENSMLTL